VEIVGGAECKPQIYKTLHCGHYLTFDLWLLWIYDYDSMQEKKPKHNRTEQKQGSSIK
jgi:hypothetical protein